MTNSNNLDGSLSELAREINELTAQTRSSQEAMGRKLLEVRALLCARNGEHSDGPLGADCRRPIGWGKWIAENLSMHRNSAARCVKIAVSPNEMLAYDAALQKRRRRGASFLKNHIRHIWPLLSEDERNGCLDLMLSI